MGGGGDKNLYWVLMVHHVQMANCDSEMARSTGGGGWMARPEADREPRRAIIDDLSSENDNLQRSQHIVGP